MSRAEDRAFESLLDREAAEREALLDSLSINVTCRAARRDTVESTQTAQRRNTAWLLGRVMDDPQNHEAVDALVEALQEGEGMTRQFAATSLAEIGGSHVQRQLLAIAEDEDADSDVRGQAVFVLGKVGDKETARRLQSLLDSTEDEQVRQKTFSALSKLGGHSGD
jgi:HEAT repeat protein